MKIKQFLPISLPGILLISSSLYAQTYTESSAFGKTYTPLSNPTLITNSWKDSLFLQGNIHATFNWFGQSWPFDGQGDDGILLFGAGTLAGGSPTDSTDFDFDGFFTALQSKSNSEMNYEIDGTTPNRIIKFEWKNTGLAYGDTSDYVNFQMWLYEDAAYEVHFGASSVKDPNVAFGNGKSGPPIGLFFASTKTKDNNKILKAFYLTGNPSSPTLNPSADYDGLSGMPANGTVYTFNYTANSGINIFSDNHSGISIFPDPAKGNITISYKPATECMLQIDILDLNGKSVSTVYNGLVSKDIQNFQVQTADYPKGIYLVRVLSGMTVETRKLIIQ